jgi:pSer/pThr/pTyr-binding forkhead associated (FHA) protein
MDEQTRRDEERLIIKMKERGNFPWFEYFVDGKGGTWQMTRPSIIVGRQDGCNWLVPNGTVSRKHFKVSFNGSEYSLEDLGSSNGVVVNGRKVSRCRLQSSDVIEFGNVRATFHI